MVFRRFGDCESDTLGTGSGRCDIRSFGDPRGIILFQKGWSLPVGADLAATLTETIYKSQLAQLIAFPLTELYNFEQPTPENEKNTSSTGILTEVRAGKPQFSFMYDKGSCFHKALYDKRGKNRWDLGIIFETGVLLASNQAATEIRGFDMGMLSVETFKFVQGTDPEMSTAMIQLVDADQFNDKHEFFTFDALGFNMNLIDGVVELSLSYNVAPTATTSIVLDVVGSCNADELVAGLDDAANWRLGGTQASATTIDSIAYDAVNGRYTLTLTPTLATGDTVQPELFNSTDSVRVVEDATGTQYKGRAPLATIA